jgi:hypothetical protein
MFTGESYLQAAEGMPFAAREIISGDAFFCRPRRGQNRRQNRTSPGFPPLQPAGKKFS